MEEYKALERGLKRLEIELEAQRKLKNADTADQNEEDLFFKTMTEFYTDASDHFSKVQVICQEMCEAYDIAVKYFGEDPEKMLPDEFFGILFRFRTSWKVMNSDAQWAFKYEKLFSRGVICVLVSTGLANHDGLFSQSAVDDLEAARLKKERLEKQMRLAQERKNRPKKIVSPKSKGIAVNTSKSLLP